MPKLHLHLPAELLDHTSAVSGRELADLLREDQRRHWSQGERVRVEDYLAVLPTPPEQSVLLDLIHHEYLLLAERGEVPPLDDFIGRFPQLETPLRHQLALDDALARGGTSEPQPPTVALETHSGVDKSENAFPVVPGYEVLAKLGEGGMGVVFKARHVGLNRTVALKMIRRGRGSADARRRFRAEAEAVARLQHPGIVQIHDIGEVGGELYCAFEFLSGGSLNDQLRQSVLSPPRAARLVVELARGMAAVHSLNLVHRDLKPANILMTKDGAPRIADFGLSKFLDDPERGDTQLGTVLGTPSYMAPEQAAGDANTVTPAADIYSLGAILYECLTGRPPFKGATVAETLGQVRTREPVPVRQLQPDVPRDLDAICLMCLRKQPRARYASTHELADDLERFLEGRSVRARPVGTVKRLWRWVKRRPVLAVLSLLLGVSLLTLLVGGWWMSLRVAHESGRAGSAEAEATTARELAQTRELFGLLAQARERTHRPLPGWTWALGEDVRRAAALSPSGEQRAELRELAAEAFAAVDVRESRVLLRDFQVGQIACAPSGSRGGLLALAEPFHGVQCKVQLLDAATGEPRQQLSFLSSLAYGLKSGRADGIHTLAFSPDGRWLVAGSRSGTLHRWDVRAPNPVEALASWQAHPDDVNQVAFSSDGKSLYSLSKKAGVLKRWSATTATWTLAAEQQVSGPTVLVHPAGVWIGCAQKEGSGLLSPETLQPVGTWKTPLTPHADAISPDGRLLAEDVEGQLKLVDTDNGAMLRQLRQPWRETAHDARLVALRFSPDGSLLASLDAVQRVRLWELASGRLAASWTVPDAHRAGARLAFLSDNRLVVSGGKTTRLYEIGGLDVQSRLASHPGPVGQFRFSPHGGSLVCQAGPSEREEVTRWRFDGATAQLVARRFSPQAYLIDVHPDSMVAAVTAGDHVCPFNLKGGPESKPFPAVDATAIGFAPDGRLWGTAKGEVHCWDFPGGQPAKKWNTRLVTLAAPYPSVSALAVGRRGVLAGGQFGQAWLLRLEQGAVRPVGAAWRFPTRAALGATAWNADETLAVFGNDAGEVYVVRPGVEGPPLRLAAHRDIVTGVAFDRAGLLATGGRDSVVRLWRPEGEAYREELSLRLPGPVAALAFTADGNGLAVLVDGEFAVRLWRLDRLREKLVGLNLDP